MPIYFYETKIGKIAIAEQDSRITNLYFETDGLPKDVPLMETPLLKEAGLQLKHYLAGELMEFSFPLSPSGTDFFKQVWMSLCEIPYGKTATYQEIASKLNNPNAARAVGLANNRNPIPIFIPCHRVIGSNGSLTGYRGGIDTKQKLLELEKKRNAHF